MGDGVSLYAMVTEPPTHGHDSQPRDDRDREDRTCGQCGDADHVKGDVDDLGHDGADLGHD